MRKTQSPAKSRASGAESPSQASPSRAHFLQSYGDQSIDPNELRHKILELANENEHDKNMLIAVNVKLQVFNDMKLDVNQQKAMFQNSETERAKLQQEIRNMAQKALADADEHEKQRNQLIEENQNLRDTIQKMKTEKAQTQQAHRTELNNLNAAHAAREQ